MNRLLFIATLVYNGHAFRMYHQQKKPSDNSHVEMHYASQVYQQQPVQAQQQPYDPTYYDKQAQAQAQTMPYDAPGGQQQAYEVAYAQQDPYQQQQAYNPSGH
jgi:hypothetical protein